MNETIRTRTGEIRITDADETAMRLLNTKLNEGNPPRDRFDDLLTFASKVGLAGSGALAIAVIIFVIIHGGYHA